MKTFTPSKRTHRLIFSSLIGLLIGLLYAAMMPGSFWISWISASFLLAASTFALWEVTRWAGSEQTLVWMVLIGFGLRLILGLGLHLALPVVGYEGSQYQAGYLFLDAFKRDSEAWGLAQSGAPLLRAFGSDFISDQYGGLLAFSSLVYRLFSPDAHRPELMLILSAVLGTIGIPFLFKGLNQSLGKKIALSAGWIFTLYPESLLMGATHMREPYLMGLGAMAFYALVTIKDLRSFRWPLFIASIVFMTLISTRVAFFFAAASAVYMLIMVTQQRPAWQKALLYLAIAASIVLFIKLSWQWLFITGLFDMKMTEQGSGWIAALIQTYGEDLRLPFLTAYGLLQPVLPAAILEPSSAFAKAITIFRSLGWYALLPLLLYSMFALWKALPREHRPILAFALLASIGWILPSSFRAGGDLWDNPRYRTHFLVWIATLCGWGWTWAREHRDPWLWRWAACLGIFVAFFLYWYTVRYYIGGTNIPFIPMLLMIVGFSALVLASGWIWDRLKQHGKR